jgi:hypothetical protein
MGWLQNHVFDPSNSTFYQEIELEVKESMDESQNIPED